MPAGRAAEHLATATREGPGIVVGTPWVDESGLHNSVLLLEQGKIAAIRHKVELPNYGVFDELRVFKPGPLPGPVDFRGVRVGLPICEDIWLPARQRVPVGDRRRDPDRAERLALLERQVGPTHADRGRARRGDAGCR